MAKVCTDREQSKRLLELGLNPETADMYYGYLREKPELLPHRDVEVKALCLPAWSLGALLELMPEVKTEHGIMQPYLVGGVGRRFRFMCFYKITYNTEHCYNALDAAFEQVCWLLESGHIKTNKE